MTRTLSSKETFLRIVYGYEAARATLLRRTPLNQMAVSPELAEGIRRVFGEPLTPEQVVERIIADVRHDGDRALRDYTLKLDGVALKTLEVSREDRAQARSLVSAEVMAALELAAERIRAYHEAQKRAAMQSFQEKGLGQIVRPLERVGIYVPGGTALYPSTLLMTAIPARVAGVDEVILTTSPARERGVSPIILAAADIAGVDRIFAVGGAQAIAALAYGTESIPKVDKICGPGNLFVILAKQRVYGVVGIDGLPGPTETVIVADDSADPALCAADLLAQAEHDVLASAILITTSDPLAQAVALELEAQLASLPRKDIAFRSLMRQGGIAVVESIDEALALANEFAPEHLCLLVRDAETYVERIRHAGGIFLGEGSPEAIGDYTAGPSHVMPTSGTARFSSPLGVDDFLKRISVVSIDQENLQALASAAEVLALAEGLSAHAGAAARRIARQGEA